MTEQQQLQCTAVLPPGLEECGAAELSELGASAVKPLRRAVAFRTDLAGFYRMQLQARLPFRLLRQLAAFPCRSREELYAGVQSAANWEQWLPPELSFRVDASGSLPGLSHSHYSALQVKNALVDWQRQQWGQRSSVDLDAPDLHLHVHLGGGQAQLSVDGSGDSLHRRGYRPRMGLAPLKENLAAGLIRLTGWDGRIPLADPLCGSGTLLIEAACMALGRPPGLDHRFALERWPDFNGQLWNQALELAAGSGPQRAGRWHAPGSSAGDGAGCRRGRGGPRQRRSSRGGQRRGDSMRRFPRFPAAAGAGGAGVQPPLRRAHWRKGGTRAALQRSGPHGEGALQRLAVLATERQPRAHRRPAHEGQPAHPREQRRHRLPLAALQHSLNRAWCSTITPTCGSVMPPHLNAVFGSSATASDASLSAIPLEAQVLFIGVVFLGTLIVSRFSIKIGIPAILGVLALGLMINIRVLDVGHAEVSKLFVFSLALLLFYAGLKTDIQSIRGFLNYGLFLAVGGVAISTLILGLAIYWFSSTSGTSLELGFSRNHSLGRGLSNSGLPGIHRRRSHLERLTTGATPRARAGAATARV